MSPKKRSSNKHLPPRVYQKHGAFYYVDINRKWHRLGSTFSDAMSEWSKMINPDSRVHVMNQIFDRYMVEVATKKSPKSYKNNQFEITNLRSFFGEMKAEDITAVEVYRYLDIRSVKAKVGANREKSLLSHVFSMAIRWGIVKDNPCRNVKRITEKPRQRYITDSEYKAVKDNAPEIIKCVMDFAYLTGQRIGDILKIKLSELTDEGIKIEQGKTGSKIIIEWSDELREVVSRIRKLPHTIYGMTLICNLKGSPYTVDGFSTMWQKIIKKALANGLIKETFTFHDIRAKTRSDSEDGKAASELLGHADPRITERIYNRKHKKVRPIR